MDRKSRVLTIPWSDHELSSVEELERTIPEIRAAQFSEISIDLDENRSLFVLTNGTHGTLTYFFGGDFLSAINQGPETDRKTVDFRTLSGCGDTPLAPRYAFPIDLALRAMLDFAKTGSLPGYLIWKEE
jgi:hypothetical protein